MMTTARRVAAIGVSAALLVLTSGAAQPPASPGERPAEVVRIWTAAPQGTEGWSGPEAEVDAELPNAGMVHIVTNVTAPSFTVFRPPAGSANGTAMLVVPGGAFRALAWDLEGTEVAQWLSRRGITAFVLRYRVRPPVGVPSGPENFDAWLRRMQPARDIAAADARQALRLIRASAARYGVAADRVGAIGFSAGAMTVIELALSADPTARPDFAASIYGAMPSDRAPSPGAPPLFLVAAQDDRQVPSQRSLDIHQRWTAARLPAELHLYERGGHGFGIRRRNLPADDWPQALEAWLVARGVTTPPAAPSG